MGPVRAAGSHFRSTSGNSVGRPGEVGANGFRRSPPWRYGANYASLPFPFFGDGFDPDNIYSTGYPVASQPPEYVLQQLRGLPDASNAEQYSSRSTPASEPMMIELQNGRYVQVSNAAIDGEALPLPLPRENASREDSRADTGETAPTLTPAILIFRDGHKEEVRDYAIADGILYARGDFYTDGYWNKNIALSNLNVAETVQANAARNVDFTLPSSPNEVITRP